MAIPDKEEKVHGWWSNIFFFFCFTNDSSKFETLNPFTTFKFYIRIIWKKKIDQSHADNFLNKEHFHKKEKKKRERERVDKGRKIAHVVKAKEGTLFVYPQGIGCLMY